MLRAMVPRSAARMLARKAVRYADSSWSARAADRSEAGRRLHDSSRTAPIRSASHHRAFLLEREKPSVIRLILLHRKDRKARGELRERKIRSKSALVERVEKRKKQRRISADSSWYIRTNSHNDPKNSREDLACLKIAALHPTKLGGTTPCRARSMINLD
jgi:hypothetical protein